MTSDNTATASPYMGLSSFEETDRDLFHGRETESSELFQTVQRETLTVVFGMSGLGKSSLLRAGLFPQLREAGLFPIVVRLTYKNRDLVEQIREAIGREIKKHDIDAAPPTSTETLWEYFHRTPFWDSRNRLLVPVIVVDQFEELFTLGARDAARDALITELADLIENRIPESVRSTGDADALPPGFEQAKAKIVFSLREDYLARLEDLKTAIPSLSRGRFRLRAMDGKQAVRAIRHPRTERLIDAEVAEHVARFVAGAGDQDTLDVITIEPALLSLVCRQLDVLRVRRNEDTISAGLLQGESGRILDDFYEQSIAGLPPDVGAYLEEHLLTPDGHRTTVALSNVKRVPGMSAAIDVLVDRRILRIEERLGRPHVEVIHDVLTRVMVARKERRLGEAARRRRSTRRIAIAGVAALVAAGVVGGALYLGARRRLEARAEEDRAVVEQERQRSGETLVDEATRVLARGDTWSAARLLSVAYGVVGDQRSDTLAMLVRRFSRLDEMLVASLPLGSASLVAFELADDGSRLFIAAEDGTITVWDKATGKTRTLAVESPAAVAAPAGAGSGSSASPGAATHLDAFAVTRDGAFAVGKLESRLVLWDVATGKQLAEGTSETTRRGATTLRTNIDGTWVTLSKAGTVEVFHRDAARLRLSKDWPTEPRADCPATPRATWDYDGRDPYGDWKDSLVTTAFSGDGKTLVVSDGPHSTTTTWRLGDDEPVRTAVTCGAAASIELDRAGHWLVRDTLDEYMRCRSKPGYWRDQNCPREDGRALMELRDGTWTQVTSTDVILSFDSRQPDVALVRSAGGLERANLKTGERTKLRDGCDDAGSYGLTGGQAIVAASCGYVAFDGHATVAGSLPLGGELAVAGGGQLVAQAQDRTVRLWHLDRELDPVVSRAAGAVGPIARAKIAPGATWTGTVTTSKDGRTIVVASRDVPSDSQSTAVAGKAPTGDASHTLGIYNIEDKPGTTTLTRIPVPMPQLVDSRGRHGVAWVELDPSQTRVLSLGRDGHARVWQRADGAKLLDLPPGTAKLRAATFTPDGERIATIDDAGTLCAWSAKDGGSPVCVKGTGVAGRWSGGAMSSKGMFATSDVNGTVLLWDLTNKPAIVVGKHALQVDGIEFDATGRWLATAGDDAVARVWDLAGCTGNCREVAHLEDRDGFDDVALISDGPTLRFAATSHASRLHVVEVDVDRPATARVISLTDWASSTDVSPEGRLLLCHFDGAVDEWDVKTGALTGRMLRADEAANGWCTAKYVGDGKRFVVQRTSGDIEVWSHDALIAGLDKPSKITAIALDDQKHVITYQDVDTSNRDVRVRSRDGTLLAVTYAQTPPRTSGAAASIFGSPSSAIALVDSRGTITTTPVDPDGVATIVAVSHGERLVVRPDLHYELAPATAPDRRPIRSMPSTLPHGAIFDAELSRDGWIVSLSSDGTVTRYDRSGRPNGNAMLRGLSRTALATSGDGVLAIGDNEVAMWTAAEPPVIRKSLAGLYRSAAAWDPTAGILAVAAESDQVEVRDVASDAVRWRERKTHGVDVHYTSLVRLGVMSGKTVVATASEGFMATYAVEDGKLVTEFPEHIEDHSDLRAMWFLPDGNLLTHDEQGVVSLWDGKSGKRLKKEPNNLGLARGPGERFAKTDMGGIHVLTYKDRALQAAKDTWTCKDAAVYGAVAWSATGRYLAAVYRTEEDAAEDGEWICLIDATTGKQLLAWPSKQHAIWRLSFRSDETALLSVGGSRRDGVATPAPRLFEVPTGKLLHVFDHEDLVTAGFAKGTPYIVTADTDGTLRIYDARAGSKAAESRPPAAVAHRRIAKSVIDEASGKLVTIDERGAIAVIELATGRRLSDITTGEPTFTDLAIAPGGATFAVAYPNRVDVWGDANVPRKLDAASVVALAFSPDGRLLAAADGFQRVDEDEPVRGGLVSIWTVADASQVLQQSAPQELTAVAWSTDGRELVVGGASGFIQIFELGLETRAPKEVGKILDRMAPKTTSSPSAPRPTTRRRGSQIDI